MLLPVKTCVLEGHPSEIPYGVARASGHHVVAGLARLQHPPHRVGELGGVTPIAARAEAPEVDLLLEPRSNPGHGPSNFARDEGLASSG